MKPKRSNGDFIEPNAQMKDYYEKPTVKPKRKVRPTQVVIKPSHDEIVEAARYGLMARFSNVLSMDEISNYAHSIKLVERTKPRKRGGR